MVIALIWIGLFSLFFGIQSAAACDTIVMDASTFRLFHWLSICFGAVLFGCGQSLAVSYCLYFDFDKEMLFCSVAYPSFGFFNTAHSLCILKRK